MPDFIQITDQMAAQAIEAGIYPSFAEFVMLDEAERGVIANACIVARQLERAELARMIAEEMRYAAGQSSTSSATNLAMQFMDEDAQDAEALHQMRLRQKLQRMIEGLGGVRGN